MLNWLKGIDWRAIVASALILIAAILIIKFTGVDTLPSHQENGYSETQSTDENVQDIAAQTVAKYTKVLAWFTAILAVASIVQGLCIFYQLKLARAEFTATHRPHIKIIAMENDFEEIPSDEGLSTGAQVLCKNSVIIRFVNIGTADAVIKEIGTVVVEAQPLSPIFTDFEKIDGKDYRLASGEEETHLSDDKFFRFFRDEDPQLFCAGYIEYADAAGKHRKTGFCWWKPQGSGKEWECVRRSSFEYSY